jgi:L-cysteine:1D-myo-inositol 2-amino-2-deoxy-alpha-D-glucopyranoside ligase
VEAWPSPDVPRLPGAGLPLRLFDTASGQVVPTSPGPIARMYVCGITPYDATHLGHAATYVTFDLVNRAWRDAGHDVHYVQNVTDIDDPLLERAVATGQDWTELARRETAKFGEDMTALRVLAPDHYVGAVEAIPGIVDLIQQLQRLGAAYDVDGDIYFDLRSDPRFGGVANLSRDQMLTIFAERGGDPDRPGKRDPLDCLLWLQQRPDEPAWETALGHGRPGWHIECTAIALAHLGMSFDVQGGGSDLAFPHHEMGASEAHVLTGEWPYARAYVHAGMVGLDGAKMSKSRGNLVFVSMLRADGVDPMAIRLALLAHHYRQDWEWSDADLAGATKRLDAWRAAVTAARAPSAEPVIARLREALSDDLDAPRALHAVDAWVDEVGRARGEETEAGQQVAEAVDSLLGIGLLGD